MTNHKALIIDDEPDIRELLTMTLEQMDLQVSSAALLSEAKQLLEHQDFAFCLTDMKLPDGDGLSLVEHIQENYPRLPVAVITAHGSTELAVEALKRGAFDFVSKPVQLKRLRSMVQTALELTNDRKVPRTDIAGLIGESDVMESLRQQIRRVARSQAPIFITGESGSGKELVARAIHYHGPRSHGPFIPVNCGAIPSELMESEFFGHKKGSFTGAISDKRGLFQAADGGTLFLDEVADLPIAMQVKLLRAIQEKTVRPIGMEEEAQVDVRILSATHKNLITEISNGQFREDLFYRINVIELPVPPLRDRADDIPLLARQFLEHFAREAQVTPPELTPAALKALKNHAFPGNVRELENTLERAFTLHSGESIDEDDLNLRVRQTTNPTQSDNSDAKENHYVIGGGQSIDDHLAEIERNIITRALEENRWNRTATAEKLGISFRQLRYKLQKLEIE